MKLRLLDDSIRLRLSRRDVATVDEYGAVAGQTRFPHGDAFTYVLEALPNAAAGASFADNCMVVRLPTAQIAAWAKDTDAVSLRSEVKLPGGGPLKLLVEKDFTCLTHRPDEDQSDLFSNPELAEC